MLQKDAPLKPEILIHVLYARDPEIIGGCSLYEVKGRLYSFGSLWVTPARRGEGWATWLIEEAQKLATREDMVLQLSVGGFGKIGLSDKELAAFYRRHGFKRKRWTKFMYWYPSGDSKGEGERS